MPTLIELLTDWMPSRRWFAGAAAPALRHLGSYVLDDPAPEPGVRAIIVPLIADESGAAAGRAPVVYQVPLVLRDVDTSVEASGYLGSVVHDGETHAVVDGPCDPAFARALLRLVEAEGRAGGEQPSDPTTAFGMPMPGAKAGEYGTSRVLSGEQSNTSIIYEMRRDGRPAAPLIVKLFRTISDGENPDVTLQTALASAGSLRVPPVLGHVSGSWPDPRVPGRLASGHLAFAQEFLPGVEDAWRVALRAAETGDDFLEAAASLGEATAETHAILREVMPTAVAGPAEIKAAIGRMRARFDEAAHAVPDLARHRDAALAAYEAAAHASWPTLQRIHGDYHLGQVLAAPDRGWVLLDFEGEPLRPLASRNLPDVPARDVAGMLRSFDYVAGSLSMQAGSEQARDWAEGARRAFLDGYRRGLAEREGAEAGAVDERLLAAYELDKAVYEARYEALHRPGWLPIPMRAIERILA